MPAMVPPVSNERECLLRFLAQQRNAVKVTAYGLSNTQAGAAPTASPLSVGGLIKHLASMERSWAAKIRCDHSPGDADAYLRDFVFGDGDDLDTVVADYDEASKETDSTVAAIDDLGQPVPVPKGVPWFPDDVDAWSVRWVLAHLIEETARHAGHADIVRESVDGAAGFALVAAAETASA